MKISLWGPAMLLALSAFGIVAQETPPSANILAADELRLAGHYQEAERIYRAALEEAEHDSGAALRIVSNLNRLAMLMKDMGRYAEGAPLARRAVAIRKELQAPPDAMLVGILNNLAMLLLAQGKYDEADRTLRQSLSIGETVLREEHPETVSALHNSGLLAYERKQYSRCERIYRQVLALDERRLGLADGDDAGWCLGAAVPPPAAAGPPARTHRNGVNWLNRGACSEEAVTAKLVPAGDFRPARVILREFAHIAVAALPGADQYDGPLAYAPVLKGVQC
jgi:tetratricopeptide (TPR) repeat protein